MRVSASVITRGKEFPNFHGWNFGVKIESKHSRSPNTQCFSCCTEDKCNNITVFDLLPKNIFEKTKNESFVKSSSSAKIYSNSSEAEELAMLKGLAALINADEEEIEKREKKFNSSAGLNSTVKSKNLTSDGLGNFTSLILPTLNVSNVSVIVLNETTKTANLNVTSLNGTKHSTESWKKLNETSTTEASEEFSGEHHYLTSVSYKSSDCVSLVVLSILLLVAVNKRTLLI